MRFEHAKEIDPVEWNALVASDSAATFFARAEWPELVASASPDASPFYLLAYDGGRLVAGLPAVRTRRLGFSIIESLPHGTYGGVVSAPGCPPEAVQALLERYQRMALEPPVAAAHLMDIRGIERGLERFRARDEGAQIVRLDRPFDEIWSGFRPSARNKIRKARKAGIRVRRGAAEADFRAYHSMLVELSADWGGPCLFGLDFFVALSRLPAPNVQMWVAEGHRVYDLGSSAGIRGVETFKAAFGTERIPLRLLSAEKLWYRLARRIVRPDRGRG